MFWEGEARGPSKLLYPGIEEIMFWEGEARGPSKLLYPGIEGTVRVISRDLPCKGHLTELPLNL